MHTYPAKCQTRNFIISPPEIHFLRFILEAYEGIAVVTTLDPKLGLVQVSIAPGCEEMVGRILESEKIRLGLRPVTMNACAQP